MHPLLDLDSLHAQYRKQKIRNIVIGLAGLLFLGVSGIAIASRHHAPAKTATVSVIESSGSNNQSIPNGTSQNSTTPNPVNTPGISSSTPSTYIAPSVNPTNTSFPTPPPNCSVNQAAYTQMQQIQAQMQSLGTQIDTVNAQIAQGYNPSSGLTYGEWSTDIQNKLTQLKNQQNQLTNEYNNAKAQASTC